MINQTEINIDDSDDNQNEVINFDDIQNHQLLDDIDNEIYNLEEEQNKYIHSDESNEENLSLIKNEETIENNKRQVQEHYYWIDLLRIFASYMVIVVHTCACALTDEKFSKKWYGSRFWNAINRPCVPLFIMISGTLFLNPKKEYTTSKIYKKYIYRIVKVLFFWNILYATFCKFVINGIKTKYTWDKQLILMVFKEIMLGKYHQWYLYTCIGLYMVTPFLRAICKDKQIMKQFIITSLTISQAIPFLISLLKEVVIANYILTFREIIDQMNIYIVGGFVCHYMLGYYLNAFEIKNKVKLIGIYVIGLISLIFTFSIQIILTKKYFFQVNEYEDYTKLNVTFAAIGIFLFFKYPLNRILGVVFKYNKVKSLLLKFSGLTFGIYQVHVLYLDLFENLDVKYYDANQFILIPCHSLLVWLLSALTIYIMKKISFLKQFV